MRACSLHIAEAHPSKVVKVLVEPQQHSSQTLAFLLTDGSCVLISLLLAHPKPLLRIPKPCSDAAFLVLQTRGANPLEGPVKPSNRALDHFKHAKVESGQEIEVQQGSRSQRARTLSFSDETEGGSSSKGRRVLNEKQARVCFLTVSPAKGGACVDISAWLCAPHSLPRIAVNTDPTQQITATSADRASSHTEMNDRQFSLRLDIPHGFSVKMAASVNVIVLYSASAGRVWIMAAKLSSVESHSKDQNPGSFSAGGTSGTFEKSRGRIGLVADGIHSEHVKRVEDSLILIKCSVVDCNGPVFSLHLSFQHMLLGQQGGVRVWPLRPLIKPRKRPRDQGTNKIEVGKRTHHSKEFVKDAKSVNPGFKVQGSDEETRLDTVEGEDFCLKKGGDNELVAKDCLESVSFDLGGLVLHDATPQTADYVGSSSADAKRSLEITGLEVHHRRNGMLSWNLDIALERRNHLRPSLAASGHQCSISRDPKKHLKQNGQINSLFVPFSSGKKEACLLKGSTQVAGIEQLSLSDFVVLDSAGKLHLLSLQKAMFSGEYLPVKSEGEDPNSRFLEMKPLKMSLVARSFAILPTLLESGLARATPSSSKIWISDGAHSIHIVSVSDSATVDDDKSKGPSQDAESVCPPSLQAVFSGDRVLSLLALAEDTILILTEKSIVVYAVPMV